MKESKHGGTMLYKIEEIRWNEMEKNIEEIPISMMHMTYQPAIVFKLPIFGCHDTDEEHYTVTHYGDLCRVVSYDVITNSIQKEVICKQAYKSIKEMFKKMQKDKIFKWYEYEDEDYDDRICHNKEITHIMPISNKDFYKHGYERFYPKEMEIAVKQILVDSKKRFKEWK